MRFFILILLLSCLLLSCGCQKKTSKRKDLKVSLSMDPVSIDPRKNGDLVSSTILFMLYQGLTELQPDGTVQMALAKSYDLSEDKKTYTFHIRDCYWSDGTPITAEDFETSWKKILDPKFPALCGQLFYCIKNAEAAAKGKIPLSEVKINARDPKTLTIELEQPTPYFLSLTSFCVFFPVPHGIDEKDPLWETHLDHLVTSGPMILSEWQHQDHLLLKKNPLFWDEQNIHLESIHVSIISNDTTALQLFEKGELDWIGTPASPLPLDSIPQLKKRQEFQSFPIGGTTFCAFNLEKAPFHNKNIRKAFAYALHRQAIVDNITQLGEIVATRCIPPILMDNQNKVLIEDHNISLAKSYLEKGLKELNLSSPKQLQITFTHKGTSIQKKLAQALKEEWEKTLGVTVHLKQEEEKICFHKLHQHDFQIALALWLVQYDDPMNILERFKYKEHPKNYPGWENEEFIALLNASCLAKDPTARKHILEQAETLFMEELPIIPLYHHTYSILTQPYVHHLEIGPAGDIHFSKAYLTK